MIPPLKTVLSACTVLSVAMCFGVGSGTTSAIQPLTNLAEITGGADKFKCADGCNKAPGGTGGSCAGTVCNSGAGGQIVFCGSTTENAVCGEIRSNKNVIKNCQCDPAGTVDPCKNDQTDKPCLTYTLCTCQKSNGVWKCRTKVNNNNAQNCYDVTPSLQCP